MRLFRLATVARPPDGGSMSFFESYFEALEMIKADPGKVVAQSDPPAAKADPAVVFVKTLQERRDFLRRFLRARARVVGAVDREGRDRAVHALALHGAADDDRRVRLLHRLRHDVAGRHRDELALDPAERRLGHAADGDLDPPVGRNCVR